MAQGKTWDQIAAFVGHLDQRTTQRYIRAIRHDILQFRARGLATASSEDPDSSLA